MSSALLEVRGLCRSYGSLRAVDDLSFAFEKGQVYGFIGPNGAGKTTTMRMLATLDLPDGGDAFVDGLSILVEPRKVRMQVGFMADRFVPYPNLDVVEFLDFFARAYGLRGRERIRTIESVCSFCGLDDFRNRPSTGLSKGMAQRLHLAKTLLHDPSLLILDEPAAGLDPHARIDLRHLLGELAAAGKGILISSHILSELSESCDGVVVIERGRRVVSGALDEIAKEVREHHAVRVRLLGEPDEAERFFLTQPHVQDIQSVDHTIEFDFTGDEEEMAALLQRAIGAGLRVVEFRQREADLEDIFMRTTKGKLQ
ncbi:MAG: ABC transporter ATP-binding protein [Planctomycetota bacterium]